MIELIIVLVVMAIIASFTMPRLKRDTRSEAINHMLTMIRYTQNLALHDNKHQRFNSRWQSGFWRFQIFNCKGSQALYYMIGTHTNSETNSNKSGWLNRSETAIDPSNGKFTFWRTDKTCPKNSTDILNNEVSPNIFITQKYGISSVEFESCSIYKNGRVKYEGKLIGYDSFGRPHKSFTKSTRPSHWGYAVENCNITFSFKDSSINPFTIVIPNESGYAYLQENKNL